MISGLLTAVVIGLFATAWVLMSQNRGGAVVTLPPTPANNELVDIPTVPLPVDSSVPIQVPTGDIAVPPAVPTGSPPPEGSPPRVQLGEFKALWDDAANRPIIIDTRNDVAFQEGHIPGAILVPESELASKVASLPKDKLIIAYCQ